MKIFRKRWFVASIGLLLVGLLIWFAGPYLAFADYHPFAPAWVRITLIALIVLFYVGGLLWKKFKAMQASATLAAAVSRPAAVATAGSADTEQLRQRFDEAIAQLKKDKKRVNLYELPWYVIIGAPGAGKTTVLRNSGLNFPLEQKFGREAMRGVGGTRNCDWWFTNEAVLLDTAGRYTTQDSDQAADNAGWKAFLGLLVKYRKRRPLNGVILALSAADLLTQHAAEREQHIAALARRLDELERELRVRLPVYVLVTKSDLVAGFSEYFEDLALKERTQVWGVTFPYAKAPNDAVAERFPAEFSNLVRRLNERMLGRVEGERDPRRKQAIFGFPQQWSSLGESLQAYLRGLFASGRPGGAPMLRGVYFTSGTQEGNPIDRILGAVGRNIPQEAVLAPAAGAGKAYFIERLLREVMFAESGLAGVNRAAERRGLLLQVATLAAAALFAVLGITLLSVSYARNKAYVTSVDAAVREIDATPASAPLTLQQGLPRLDALNKLVALASRSKEGAPLSMRWGLYRGGTLGDQARDAYLRELNGFLLPKMAAAIQARLLAYTAEPDKLYEYLKAYIMLGKPEHMDPAQLQALLDIEWEVAFPDQPEMQRSLSGHVRELLQARNGLRPMAIDEELVRQAQVAIRQASVPKLIFSAIRLEYAGTAGGVRVGSELGIGGDKVLVRASRKPLDEEVPALYTPAVFDQVKVISSRDLIDRFAEGWVLGEAAIPSSASEQMGKDVMSIYEDNYIAAWDAVLKDFKVAPFRTVDELRNGLAIIAGPSSPLRALLQLVDRQTLLIKPVAKDATQSITDKAEQAVKNRLGRLLDAAGKPAAPAAAPPGTRVTQHFAELHRYVDASQGPAPIDRHLALIAQVQQRLQSVGTGLGEVNPLDAVAQSGSGDAVKSLKQEAATLPPVLADLVNQVSQQSSSVAMGQARSELANLYQTDVVARCNAIVSNRFPFQPAGSSDVPLADFGRLFGTSGIFDTFYQQRLQVLVDASRSPWRWRGSDGGSIGLPASILRQFEQAQRIREVYFPPGGQIPQVRFTVTADALDAAATRVTLEIDGQSVDYRHGPVRPVPMTWPGPAPGTAAISFEDRSGTRPNIVTNGPWALFRLVGKGTVQTQSDVRYLMGWSAGGHDAKMLVEASSISNPFSGDLLRQFSCGG